MRCFLLLVIFLNPIGSYASTIKTIKLAYSDIESFPFQMGDGNTMATPPGLSIDVIEQAAHSLNIKIQYVRLPGKRLLHHIRANQVDGGFIFSYSHERAKYASYPIKNQQVDSTLHIATLDYFFYKLKDQTLEWNGKILKDKQSRPVGAHRGFSIINKLKENEIDTLEVQTTEKLFEMLKKKRLAAVAIQSNIADSYINEKKIANIERIEPPISTKYYYLIFSHQFTKDNPKLARDIWQTIGTIRDEIIQNNIEKYSVVTIN